MRFYPIDQSCVQVLHAETGSGKSLAFLLPVLTRLGLAGRTALDPDEVTRSFATFSMAVSSLWEMSV